PTLLHTSLLLFPSTHPATTHLYPLSLHDALPISCYALVNGRRTVYVPVTKRADASTLSVVNLVRENLPKFQSDHRKCRGIGALRDRKSTRLNSSHQIISYAVFCLKKKKKYIQKTI